MAYFCTKAAHHDRANPWSDRLEIGYSIWRAVVEGVYERQQRASYHIDLTGARSNID
jgi:hypothetical protein